MFNRECRIWNVPENVVIDDVTLIFGMLTTLKFSVRHHHDENLIQQGRTVLELDPCSDLQKQIASGARQ